MRTKRMLLPLLLAALPSALLSLAAEPAAGTHPDRRARIRRMSTGGGKVAARFAGSKNPNNSGPSFVRRGMPPAGCGRR